jgi:hypothetical protein
VIPAIASSGRSFKGAAAYYLHDKDAQTRERVAWTHAENLPTRDPDRAVKVMAFTALHQAELKQQAGIRATGRKLEKPVFAFSLAWHPEQTPDKDHMLATAQSAVKDLGLSDYQTLYVAHNDEPQKHVHVIVNRVHPENGKAATLSKSKEKLSKWAQAYEKKHGKIYCEKRAEKHKSREQGSRKTKNYGDPVIQQAWERSDSGKAFAAALSEQGYHLAQGHKRAVVIDKYGKSHNPVRHLDGVKAKDFRARLKDLDHSQLPKADRLQREIKDRQRKEYHASRKYDFWAAKVLNDTQDRHLQERANLHDKYHRKIEDKKAELQQFYKTDEIKTEIERLKKQTAQKPGFLKRLTGKAKEETRQLENLERQYQDIQTRTGEQISKIERERDNAFEQQRQRHEEERQHARELVTKRQPEFYREEIDRNQNRRQEQDRDQSHGREHTREHRPGR